jgi:hypothetical protein
MVRHLLAGSLLALGACAINATAWPVAGSYALGQQCNANDTGQDCEIGNLCVSVTPLAGWSAASMCLQSCNSVGDCSLEFAQCAGGFCSPACDPVADNACPSGMHCSWVSIDSGYNAITECAVPAGSQPLGASCGAMAPCGPTLSCASMTSKCARLCYTDVTTPGCNCMPFSPSVAVGTHTLGLCQ